MWLHVLFLLAQLQPALHLVGDSQCVGAARIAKDVVGSGWRETVATCKGGTRTSYWEKAIDGANINNGDSTIVYLGSNDLGKVDATPVLKKIAAAGVRRCVWVGPPLINGRDNGAADQIRSQVEKDGTCKFLDSRQLKLRLEDGVHPGPSEHRRWLRAAVELLTST